MIAKARIKGERRIQWKVCWGCGEWFSTKTTKAAFCIPCCSERAFKPHGKVYKCVVCGTVFARRDGESRNLCCSRECGFELLRQQRGTVLCVDCGLPEYKCKCKPVYTVRCKYCDTEFTTSNQHQMYCGGRCASAAAWHRNYKSTAKPTTRTCAKCGKIEEFEQSKVTSNLCKRCQKRKDKSNRKHKQRATIKAGDTIGIVELFKRDKGRCQLCGRKVSMYKDGSKYKKRGATIDHIKALANGGTHTWDNVQLCCHECNSIKGDRTTGQLRLC